MPYDIYESKGYAKDGYIDHTQKVQIDNSLTVINTGAKSLTETEQCSKEIERKAEVNNYRTLRVEYNRYIAAKGLRNHMSNPVIPFCKYVEINHSYSYHIWLLRFSAVLYGCLMHSPTYNLTDCMRLLYFVLDLSVDHTRSNQLSC